MKGNELLDKMELIDPVYVEAADAKPEEEEKEKKKKKKIVWSRLGAMAACLCFIAGAVTMISRFGGDSDDPQFGEIILSDKTTAKVSFGYDGNEIGSNINKGDLEYLTEEEMFSFEDMYVFRGKVSGLTNVTIDFNGEKEVRCIATVLVEKVYRGELTVGEEIKMLIPCAVDPSGSAVEDTGVIVQLKSGMEGIFMPMAYDGDSRIEMNGAVLMKRDLADCGLTDGMRWAFLNTEDGLVFLRSAYTGAKDAIDLNDIEAYVTDMLLKNSR